MPIRGDFLGPLLGVLEGNKQRKFQQEQFAAQQQLAQQREDRMNAAALLNQQRFDAGAEQRGLQGQLLGQQVKAGEVSAKTGQEELRLQMNDLTPFARTIKNLDDTNKLPALQNEITRRQEANLPPNPLLQEGMQQLQSGNFEGFNSSLDEIIRADTLKSTRDLRRSYAPVQTMDEEGNVGYGVTTIDSQGGARMEPVDLQGLTPTPETPGVKREAQVQAAINKKRGEIIATKRERISDEIKTAGRTARRELINLKPIEDAFKALETGKMAEIRKLLGPYIPGVDPTNEQVLQADINKLVMMQIRNLPGALSEKELVFAEEAVARMGNTREANLLILERLKGVYNNQIEEQDQFNKFDGNAEDFEFKLISPDQLEEIQGQKDALAKSEADTQMFGALSQDKLSIIQQLRDMGLTDEQIKEGMKKKAVINAN